MVQIVRKPLGETEINVLAEETFGDMIEVVVDLKR